MLTVNIRCNGSNTFVAVTGSMTAEGVSALERVLAQHIGEAGEGRCFIDTDGLTLPAAAGVASHKARQWMHALVRGMGIAPSSVYFKGRHAFALVPEGCRVIVRRSRSRGDARDGAQSRFLRGPRALRRCAAPTQAAPDMRPRAETVAKAPGCTGDCATCPRCAGKAHTH